MQRKHRNKQQHVFGFKKTKLYLKAIERLVGVMKKVPKPEVQSLEVRNLGLGGSPLLARVLCFFEYPHMPWFIGWVYSLYFTHRRLYDESMDS